MSKRSLAMELHDSSPSGTREERSSSDDVARPATSENPERREPPAADEALGSERNELRAELQETRRSLERTRSLLRGAFEAIEQLHARERQARSGAAYRIGKIFLDRLNSPRRWLEIPRALWREYSTYRMRLRAPLTGAGQSSPAPFSLVLGDSIALPLTGDPQVVEIAPSAVSRDVWATLLSANPELSATMEIGISGDDAERSIRAIADQVLDRECMPTHLRRQLTLPIGKPVRLLHLDASVSALRLELLRVRGELCVAALELREQTVNSGENELGTQHPEDSAMVALRRFSALELDKKLWGGYATYALPELERFKHDSRVSTAERLDASWYLTRWYMAQGDASSALESIRLAHSLTREPPARFALCEVQCLLKLGRLDEAVAVLERARRSTRLPDFPLLQSTLVRRLHEAKGKSIAEIESAQLAALNKVLRSAGLAALEKKHDRQPLTLGNLRAPAKPRIRDQHEKVSVIIPAFNAAETIGWALETVLVQTWGNLEVIVVDDASTDETCAIVERISRADSRVRLIRHEINAGAYAARNTGARHASGDLIMVHDADDWSHSQRIELQIEAMRAQPNAVGVKSHWVRVASNLEIVGEWIARGTVYDLNYSSLIFRRALFEEIGLWDEVCVSGDGEFYSRIRALYGKESVLRLPPSYLVAFSLARDDSLTRSNATHLQTLFYGLRWHYRDAYLHWHAQLYRERSGLPFDPARTPRPFPIPLGNRPGPRKEERFDLIVVADFAREDASTERALRHVVRAAQVGKRVAVFHWRTYELTQRAPLQEAFYRMYPQCEVEILSPGDRARGDTLIFASAYVLRYKLSPLPSLSAERVIVLAGDRDDSEREVRAHLREIIGTEGEWMPASAAEPENMK